MKKLSKEEMKMVVGGDMDPEPGCYQCCWDAHPEVCSECVLSNPGWPCYAGAHLQSCPSPCPYQ